jgi:hypothetical protein
MGESMPIEELILTPFQLQESGNKFVSGSLITFTLEDGEWVNSSRQN